MVFIFSIIRQCKIPYGRMIYFKAAFNNKLSPEQIMAVISAINK